MSTLHVSPLPPSPKQRKVLEIIAAYLQEKGYGPSLEDIAERAGWKSTNAVRSHRDALKKKGYIDWDDGVARSLHIVSEAVA